MDNEVVQETRYRLRASADEFTRAAHALVSRVEVEGPPGLLRYSFYVNPDVREASAILVYRDAATWLGQHHFVPGLDEYAAFQETVALEELRFFGDVTPELREWLDSRNLSYELAGPLAAGFER